MAAAAAAAVAVAVTVAVAVAAGLRAVRTAQEVTFVVALATGGPLADSTTDLKGQGGECTAGRYHTSVLCYGRWLLASGLPLQPCWHYPTEGLLQAYVAFLATTCSTETIKSTCQD